MAIPNGVNSRRTYPEDSWEAMKPRIVHYYIDEGLTLERTMEALREEGFHATEKMYKTRIKKWHLKKYIKDEDAGDILRAAAQDGGVHRAHTIGGRIVTAEDAERHLKRKKKMNTWSVCQPQSNVLSPGIVYSGNDLLGSPVEERQHGGSLFPDARWINDDRTVSQEPDGDVEMADCEEVKEELTLVPTGDFEVSPNLLLTPGLQFATQSFLFGVRNFCDITLSSMPHEPVESLANRRFNKLWDIFCTKATLQQQNRASQALALSKQARFTFADMLKRGDPWLLISLCLLLNDNMSNPDRAASASSFLREMAHWANDVWSGHPIAQLIQFLRQTNDQGPHHGIALELARLHSRVMTDLGMHKSAEMLLAHDLAAVEHTFGSSSLQNLLRLSSLARCKFVASDFMGSLNLYMAILSDPLVNEPWLADIKYGAMYFVAKSNAQLGNVQLAIAQTREALQFSLDTKGEDHYWTNNARELIVDLEVSQLFRIEEVE
ncbi:hypothetical protein LTR05_000379 [Lithohypha guttulata]|uniref:Clr5 domain-containing protein n=1 Tax=Lithohypha guttulata TaxID=1690604 RepID=A0AAN7TBL2_9EURO|nr:hypothetical protein LTR05_000379 [Lithohypha guttulata]